MFTPKEDKKQRVLLKARWTSVNDSLVCHPRSRQVTSFGDPYMKYSSVISEVQRSQEVLSFK